MADTVSKTQRSLNMSRIKSAGTAVEGKLEAILNLLVPAEPVIPQPGGIGHPDFLLAELRVAVFCDGCFWHGCPKHFRVPGDNAEYWAVKIRRNKERDRRVNREIRRNGMIPVRIWEHEIEKNAASAKRKIRRAIVRALQRCNQNPGRSSRLSRCEWSGQE